MSGNLFVRSLWLWCAQGVSLAHFCVNSLLASTACCGKAWRVRLQKNLRPQSQRHRISLYNATKVGVVVKFTIPSNVPLKFSSVRVSCLDNLRKISMKIQKMNFPGNRNGKLAHIYIEATNVGSLLLVDYVDKNRSRHYLIGNGIKSVLSSF